MRDVICALRSLLERSKLVRLLFDSYNRVFPIVGQSRPQITDPGANTSIARFPVQPGDYVTIFCPQPVHGGALLGKGNMTTAADTSGIAPTTSDPRYPAGVHDFVVPAGCYQLAFCGVSGGTASNMWAVVTPKADDSDTGTT